MIAAGQSIGNYRILAKIGTGGMGAVYLAEHPQIGKRVALKVIHRELSTNKEVVQRFFQEARAVNTIGSEHIVEIHDFGVTPEGDHFYIMEYLDGLTLAAVLGRDGVFPVMRALHVGAQIANALAATHAAGVIHRDLKPDNVMLMHRMGDPDFVKVLDFGLAKMLAAGGSAVKTAVGVLLGTPQYMSPEACQSQQVDHRTDIYALGILLFQMMTGRLPFDGSTMAEVLVKQATALPPAPRGINPAIPPSVEQILLRCLAKHPEARFQTMQALREALLDPEAYLRGSPPMAAARSVAPGEAPVNAAQLLAHVAQQQAPLASTSAPTLLYDGTSRRMPAAVPDLAAPAMPQMNTMRIATPMGYSSRPPRRMWTIVLVLGLLLGLGGGAFAVAWYGRDEAPPSVADARPAEVPAGAPVDAGVTGAGATDAASPIIVNAAIAPRTARVRFETVPAGAMIQLPDGSRRGPTPLTIEWPVGAREVDFELSLPGHRKKTKAMPVRGDVTVRVELEKQLPAGKGTGKGSARRGSSDTGLMRPDDL